MHKIPFLLNELLTEPSTKFLCFIEFFGYFLTIAVMLLQAGVTLLLINLSNRTEFVISVQNSVNMKLHVTENIESESHFTRGLKRAVSWVGNRASDESLFREEYHLTAKDGNLQSQTMVLNGIPLELTKVGDIPKLDPVRLDVSSPIVTSPLSISFIVFPNFDAPACA